MKILTLNLKKEYFEDIKNGLKKEEYRIVKPYWEKRLIGKNYDKVIVKMGYPKNDEVDKILEFTWSGFIKKEITHREFGSDPVWVFAIKLII